jgi:hypothetical protein
LKVLNVDSQGEAQEFFVQINNVFDLFALDDAEQLVLKVLHDYDFGLSRFLGQTLGKLFRTDFWLRGLRQFS